MNTATDGNLLDIDNAFSSVTLQEVLYPRTEATPSRSEQVALIERARLRCIAGGLQKGAGAADSGRQCAAHRLLPRQESRDHELETHTVPVMELLALQVAAAQGVVVLANADGVLLQVWGDEGFLAQPGCTMLDRGACWSEASKGTNAIGTALAEGTPVTILGDEHFLHANRILAGTAAPVFAADGRMLGVLGIVCAVDNFRSYLAKPVCVAAQLIENQMFAASRRDTLTLRLSTCATDIGTIAEGVATFALDGRFLSVNRMGELHLALPLFALRAQTVGSLFGLPVSALTGHCGSANPDPMELRLANGRLLYCRPEVRLSRGVARSSECAPSPHPGGGRMSGLHFLNTGDPQVAAVIDKLAKVAGCNIPIMVVGETGTGKELLAHAIHQDSPRAKGPFIAVNCASIPETLIESELFGYEDGAFTGARKKGSVGKILQADGGTLFLDEIGDMPLNLQAHLLRVLQERRVTPLGSARAIPVNVEVICATNRKLREMIARGEFREDLYYRLNGLVVKLPPARERTDLEAVIDKILRAESDETRHTVAPEVMRLFKRHRWPGNFRQMRSVLRTAVLMADDVPEIRLDHLPDDFLEEAAAAQPLPDQGRDAQAAQAPAGGLDLDTMELAAIRRALEEHEGNVSAAARALGISRNTIYRKIGAAG